MRRELAERADTIAFARIASTIRTVTCPLPFLIGVVFVIADRIGI